MLIVFLFTFECFSSAMQISRTLPKRSEMDNASSEPMLITPSVILLSFFVLHRGDPLFISLRRPGEPEAVEG